MSARVERVTVLEDEGLLVRDYVRKTDGTALTQATTSSISYRVCDATDPDTLVTSGTCTVASTVFDTAQTPSTWTKDDTGYNFAAYFPGTCFPSGNKVYLLEIAFVLSSGYTVYSVKEVSTRERAGG